MKTAIRRNPTLISLVQAEIDRRFDRADLLNAANREKFFLNSANVEERRSDTEISLSDAIRKYCLKTELTVLKDVVSGKTANSVRKAAEILSQLNSQTLDLFNEKIQCSERVIKKLIGK